jgi:hypothetical protein
VDKSGIEPPTLHLATGPLNRHSEPSVIGGHSVHWSYLPKIIFNLFNELKNYHVHFQVEPVANQIPEGLLPLLVLQQTTSSWRDCNDYTTLTVYRYFYMHCVTAYLQHGSFSIFK